MTLKASSHGQWSSKMGFILAAVGSAVGLGNIWKFPYMVGDSGGAAFVLVYLLCVFLIGMPILVAEWMIGRRGQHNPINSVVKVAEQNNRAKVWGLIGVAGTLGAWLILSFYSVIGGWALSYIGFSGAGDFSGISPEGAGELFSNFLGSPGTLLGWHTAFMALVVVIVAMGVSNGLERAAKLLMPALVLLLLVLVVYGITTPGFADAMAFMFQPDLTKLTGQTVLAALGHAFFTLSLGMGIMLAYGSYLGEDVNLLKTARTVVILDTVIALLAGMAIFPVVFTNGLDASAGPGLIFVTLPLAFGQMGAGSILGVLFFILLVFAALTSAMSLLEPVVELLEERTPMNRIGATLVAGIATWLLGIASVLSLNLWSELHLLPGMTVFDSLDYLTSKFMLPLTGLGAIVFLGWAMNQDSVLKELQLSGGQATAWQLASRYIAPIGVVIVFISSLFS
ncbi:transporter [Terasakiispira papahanaumokuakeensis]|uniref:Transporter n=1 Tax=Terasakiispira papahanaumokuakeensis TaxID=197479 RepID=A0A1E2VE45_9GAMM|nr:sodium-dependent transporter [Terasakiispira papahanaumokuakeensis]ODC04935.1 transporter [Terasakiispira papahanaumokuakeensis]